jgi:hypothetical protein
LIFFRFCFFRGYFYFIVDQLHTHTHKYVNKRTGMCEPRAKEGKDGLSLPAGFQVYSICHKHIL